jgi:hypothetical protein
MRGGDFAVKEVTKEQNEEQPVGPDALTIQPQALNQLVAEAWKDLGKWADTTPKNMKVLNSLGGLPGVSVLIGLVQLDKDGNSQLSVEEKKQYEVTAQAIVDGVLGHLLNIGVVGALLLSVIFEPALAFVDITDEAPPGSRVFQILALACFQLLLALSIFMLYVASRMYVHLVFDLPNLEARVWYIRRWAKWILATTWAETTILLVAPLATLFAALCATGLWALFSLMPVAIVVLAWLWDMYANAKNMEYVHAMVKQTMKINQSREKSL